MGSFSEDGIARLQTQIADQDGRFRMADSGWQIQGQSQAEFDYQLVSIAAATVSDASGTRVCDARREAG
jgi:hypothetical protein